MAYAPRALGTGLALLLVAAGLCALWLARDVVLLAFASVILAVVFSFPMDVLTKKLPRGAAVLVLTLALLGAAAGIGWAVVPVVSHQGRDLLSHAPAAIARVRGWLAHVQAAAPVPSSAQEVEKRAAQVAESGVARALPVALSAASALAAAVLVLVLALFLVYQPDSYRRGLRALCSRSTDPVFDEVWGRLGVGLRHWVGGIIVSMAIMGGLTGAGLAIAGIKGWFVLALLTFFGTFVPYLGALASAVPGLLMGLSQSPRHFLYAAAVYLGVHITEGYIVEPLVMRRAVELRPASLLIGQALAGTVFGVLGVVVATPTMVALKILTGYLYVERRLGKELPTDVRSGWR